MPDDLCGPDTVPDARARAEAMLNVQDRDEFDAVTAFVDALTDLRHLADEYGVDFEAALSSSAMHYEAEREVPRHDLSDDAIDTLDRIGLRVIGEAAGTRQIGNAAEGPWGWYPIEQIEAAAQVADEFVGVEHERLNVFAGALGGPTHPEYTGRQSPPMPRRPS